MIARVPARSRSLASLLLAAAAMLLAGCDDGRASLQTWMAQTRESMPRNVEPIPEPKRFDPVRYEPSEEIDPFSAQRMKVATMSSGRRAAATGEPDGARPREPLEAFPLDSLKLVGNLRQGGSNVALVQVDTSIYQVREGNHIGPNHGRVLRISDDELAIREVVQDAVGDWVERLTALRLQPAPAQEKKP